MIVKKKLSLVELNEIKRDAVGYCLGNIAKDHELRKVAVKYLFNPVY